MRKLTAFLSVSLLILAFPFNTLSGDKQQFRFYCRAVNKDGRIQKKTGQRLFEPVWFCRFSAARQ